MSKTSLSSVLSALNKKVTKDDAFRKILNTKSTVLVLDEDQLYTFLIIQLYLMVYPLKTKVGSTNNPTEEHYITKEQAEEIAGIPFAEGMKVNNVGFDASTAFKGESKKLRKVASKAFSSMVEKAESMVKQSGENGVAFGKGKPHALRISRVTKNKSAYTSNSNAKVYRIRNVKGSHGDLYNQVSTKIIKRGTRIVQNHFKKTDIKFSEKKDRAGYSDMSEEDRAALPSQFNILDIGHLYASGSQLHKMVAEAKKLRKYIREEDRSEFDKELQKSLRSKLKSNVTVREDIGVKSTMSKEHFIEIHRLSGRVEVVISLESRAANRGTFYDMEEPTRKSIEKEILEFLVPRIPGMEGSPSILDETARVVLEDAVYSIDNTGKKRPPKKAKVKTRVTKKDKVSTIDTASVGFKAKAKGKAGKFIPPKDSVHNVTLSLTNMTAIINEHLPVYLKANMGKGRAKQTLNWRTGRFSRSAELKLLAEAKGSRRMVLRGVVDFMRHPYEVFSPGGKLHKPGRDPKLLINKSIRQIMKDKALSNLSFTSRLS